jgi:hypothetical protein
LWREKKGRYYSPRLAVYKALEEFSDNYHHENQNRPECEAVFIEMGNVLARTAPYMDEKGNPINPDSLLSNLWKSYADKYRMKTEKKNSREKKEREEVQSFRFDLTEIEIAWQSLVEGNIPKEASRIWYHAYPANTAHIIAERASVSLRDFMFWMLVFRSHLTFIENFDMGTTYVYYRLDDHQDLLSAISAKANSEK